MKVFLPGGAGLVGINLIASIKSNYPEWKLLVVDKKSAAVDIASKIFPDVDFLCEDLTFKGTQRWPKEIKDCEVCVMLQAEIGNTDTKKFVLNNVISTKVILKELKRVGIKRIIHISSSVVNSIANDIYTKTKTKQEKLVLNDFPDAIVLRPTLMFGWFDRKHLGWLANFMIKSPVFPIPGKGEFIRQPLFVGDFCSIIQRCVDDFSIQGIYNISGLEKIKYIQLMKILKRVKSSKTLFVFLPIPIFNFLLKIWALISRQPAFTSSQLKALTAGDQFEVIDWPTIFQINPTKLDHALKITHQDPRFSNIKMPF